MRITSSQPILNKQQIRQSFLTLLLFCSVLFFHHEHNTQIEFDIFASLEQHDCNLCQQGIGSPPNSINLYPTSLNLLTYSQKTIEDNSFISTSYICPQLRAPPTISHFIHNKLT